MEKFIPEKQHARIIPEDEFITETEADIFALGWITSARRGLLERKYLRPMYKKYEEIIRDVREEAGVTEQEIGSVVEDLNYCLEQMKRFGATDSNNILQTVSDMKRRSRTVVQRYALESMQDFLTPLLLE